MNLNGINNYLPGAPRSALSENHSLSTGSLLGLLEQILAKENEKVEGVVQRAHNADGLQQDIGANGAQGNNQGNIEMLDAQQAVGELSTFNSAATNMMNSVNDSQKAVAQNTR